MSCLSVNNSAPFGISYDSGGATPALPLISFDLAFAGGTESTNIVPNVSAEALEIVPRIVFVNGILTGVDGKFYGYAQPLVVTIAFNGVDFTLSYAGIVWYLSVTPDRVIVPRVGPDGCAVTVRGLGLPAPPVPGSKDTTIFIDAVSAPGSNCIRQVDYRVVNPQGLCQPCCNLISRVSSYRYYCVDLGCVLLNPSSPLTFQLEQYALARLMLSKLIFGEFNVNYLRRRYYEQFLAEVRRCYPNFNQFFDGSNSTYPYANYYLFFKK